MPAICAINGVLCDASAATLSVFDGGVLYGYGVFETLRTYRGSVSDVDGHLERLEGACARAGIRWCAEPSLKDQLQTLCDEQRARSGCEECYVRITVTSGAMEPGQMCGALGAAQTLVYVKELATQGATWTTGLRVRLVARENLGNGEHGHVDKWLAYMHNVLLRREAKALGYDDCVQVSTTGEVLEASSSNLFALSNEVLVTPPLKSGVLEGRTRVHVLAIAKLLGIAVKEAHVYPSTLYGAAEVFLTNTLRGVVPVVEIDKKHVGEGIPGARTLTLMRAYEEKMQRIG